MTTEPATGPPPGRTAHHLRACFGLYSRHHLVAAPPEEEFEALAAASRDVR